MFTFILELLFFVAVFIAGAVVAELIPLDTKMQWKAAIHRQWQKFTKKG